MSDGEWGVVLIAVGYPCLWLIFTFVIPRVSGWRRLAAVYPCDRRVQGTIWRWHSAGLRFGISHPGLTFTATEEGLCVTAFFLFRVGQPRLFFPWAEMCASRARGVLGFEYATLPFRGEPAVPLHLSARLAWKICDAVGPRWTEPPLPL